ncbi:cilia- and flagella-associated protein 61-like [Leptidea sinapis]|uniref:cilia- and flagella-associated protein 61-like n=1 Tax=Leptidea sinapis TaxID=189913 RepID=UPI0021C3400B|nr:cilia- and flagella-associated protein 61-like [Leptidea sinapis]
MSIYFEFDVGSTGRRFRRAVEEDRKEVETILSDDSYYEKVFGKVDVGCLIEISTLSICMINENKDVIGFASFCDHPNVPGIDPSDWETWMRNMYQKYYLSRNTLFIHAMGCHNSVEEFFLAEAMMTVFNNDAYLQQIVLMPPPDCPREFIMKHPIFKKHNISRYCAKREDDKEHGYHYFYATNRQDICPKLRIRRAVEEDNGDIVNILDKNNQRLRDLYGNYYISEVIGRHPEMNRKIIVADLNDRVGGVMCLNSDIDYAKLQNTYELDPYHGLQKATPLEKEQTKRKNTLLRAFGYRNFKPEFLQIFCI